MSGPGSLMIGVTAKREWSGFTGPRGCLGWTKFVLLLRSAMDLGRISDADGGSLALPKFEFFLG